MIAEMRNEIGEQFFITLAALRVVLAREGEGIIAEPHLLDPVIGRAPGFDLETVAEFIQRLMMRAVHLLKAMGSGTVRPQRLDIVLLLVRRVMSGNSQPQRAAKRDVE